MSTRRGSKRALSPTPTAKAAAAASKEQKSTTTASSSSTCSDPSHADLLARFNTQTELVNTLQQRIIELEEQVQHEEEAERNKKKRKLEEEQSKSLEAAEEKRKEFSKAVENLPTPALRALLQTAEVVAVDGKVCLRFKRDGEEVDLYVSVINDEREELYGDHERRIQCEHAMIISRRVPKGVKGVYRGKLPRGVKRADVVMKDEEENDDDENEDDNDDDEDHSNDIQLFKIQRYNDDENYWECQELVDLLREWKAIPQEGETELTEPVKAAAGKKSSKKKKVDQSSSDFEPLASIRMPSAAADENCTPQTFAFASTLIDFFGVGRWHCCHEYWTFMQEQLETTGNSDRREHMDEDEDDC